MTKVVIISDTHGQVPREAVPDGDVLIHCGDACEFGTMDEFRAFCDWMSALPHDTTIYVPGNHDRPLDDDRIKTCQEMCLKDDIILLLDDSITLYGQKIYGSPWTPQFGWWAFMKRRGPDIAKKWKEIPDDTDILITHGPPHKILDYVPLTNMHVGCEELAIRVKAIQPKLHLFGHVHEGHGETTINGTRFINASQVGETYKFTNKPVVTDWPE